MIENTDNKRTGQAAGVLSFPPPCRRPSPGAVPAKRRPGAPGANHTRHNHAADPGARLRYHGRALPKMRELRPAGIRGVRNCTARAAAAARRRPTAAAKARGLLATVQAPEPASERERP